VADASLIKMLSVITDGGAVSPEGKQFREPLNFLLASLPTVICLWAA
jgi:hypothetical protein